MLMAPVCFLVLSLGCEQDPAPAAEEPRQLPRLSLEADAWYASASGWIFITRGSQPGTATRAREGNAFDLDSRFLPVARGSFRFWGPSAVGFRVVRAEESGTTTARQD